MGLQDAIGYESAGANGLQRLVHRAGSSRPGAWLMARTLKPVDRTVHRITGRRHTATGLVAGLPVILLTTTGARSGVPRTSPLLAVPIGTDLAIIGSNYGTAATPAWVYNLEANPRAAVEYRGTTVDVVARAADPDEYEAAFDTGSRIYPGFPKYRARAAHRAIRVFLLGLA